jgi:2-amino-4-hydroxy-6-hydroxymethyldihydropteridine diphosphokinase
MTEVYLALGSNVGNSKAYISEAIEHLRDGVADIKIAPVYRSKAIGYTDQADFLNTALRCNTRFDPNTLLNIIKSVEQNMGRIDRFRWGPREIDVDIIFYGDRIINTEQLSVPHPRFQERGFVLKPLIDLNPSLTDPITHMNVEELYAKLDSSNKVLWAI